MIDKLLHGSLSTRLLVFILAVFLAGAGWYSYQNLTVEAFPDPTDTQVQIITLYPGQPAEEVERRVSIPLERAMNDTPGMAPLATPIGEVYRYTLDSKGADPMSLRTLNDWTIRPALLRVEGVADVV